MTTLARPRLDPLLDAPLIGPRVLQLVGDVSGCSMWRVWQPVSFLRLHGYPTDWTMVRDPGLVRVPFAYDAVVLCRLAWWGGRPRRQAEATLEGWRRRGLRVLFECDDDLITPFVVEQQLGRVNAEKTRSQLDADRKAVQWLLRRVDGVTVSTQHLASTVRRFTGAPVEVVPNAIDAEWFAGVQAGAGRTVPGPTVGWVGGNRPDSDLEAMAVAWGRIAERFPAVTFVVMGHHPPVIAEHVPPERLVRVPWMDPKDYPLGLVGIDIGCCPLEDRPFNRCKTPIKALEYGLSGAAVVASPTVYRFCVRHGETGLLASTANEWEAMLALLLEREGDRRELAANLKGEVLARWALKRHYWKWPAAWNRLWRGTA
jgi:glycosyltransferase involved in cell wall biosynthesis